MRMESGLEGGSAAEFCPFLVIDHLWEEDMRVRPLICLSSLLH